MNALMAQGTTTQDAADALKYYPVWQQEFADGNTQLQFRDWLQQQQPAPQGMMMNAMKYS
jgi:hypothetical protein